MQQGVLPEIIAITTLMFTGNENSNITVRITFKSATYLKITLITKLNLFIMGQKKD